MALSRASPVKASPEEARANRLVFSGLSSEIVMPDRVTPNPVLIGVGIDTAPYAHHVSFLDEQKLAAAPIN